MAVPAWQTASEKPGTSPPTPSTITVALCTYQGAQYLPQQLHSLLAQQRRPNEIVVFDDASKDGTWELLQAFASHAATLGVQVPIHSNPTNIGYVANFTQALLAARGDLIFLCHLAQQKSKRVKQRSKPISGHFHGQG